MAKLYKRSFVAQRVSVGQPLIQVLVGPRQVGKTTGVKQQLARYPHATYYANACGILITDCTRLREQWQKASLSGKKYSR